VDFELVLRRPIETTRLTVQVEFAGENADFPKPNKRIGQYVRRWKRSVLRARIAAVLQKLSIGRVGR